MKINIRVMSEFDDSYEDLTVTGEFFIEQLVEGSPIIKVLDFVSKRETDIAKANSPVEKGTLFWPFI